MPEVAGKIGMPGSHAARMHPTEPLHANIKANRPALPVCPRRQYRAVRHAQGSRFFQIKQAGPFIDAAFRQGPGLDIKNACKATIIRPCKNTPLVRQRIKLLQLAVIRPKIQVPLWPARFAAHNLMRQLSHMGRAVPALAKMAHSHGIAHEAAQIAKHILEHNYIIVHEKQPAARAVLKGVLVADAVAVGIIGKA